MHEAQRARDEWHPGSAKLPKASPPRRYDWVGRAAAWDAEQDGLARQAHLDAIKEANRRHALLGARLLGAAASRIAEVAVRLPQSPHTLAKWVETGARLEREALGIGPPAKAKRSARAGKDAKPAFGRRELDAEAVLAHLPPELVSKLGDLAVEVGKAERARLAGGKPAAGLRRASST